MLGLGQKPPRSDDCADRSRKFFLRKKRRPAGTDKGGFNETSHGRFGDHHHPDDRHRRDELDREEEGLACRRPGDPYAPAVGGRKAPDLNPKSSDFGRLIFND